MCGIRPPPTITITTEEGYDCAIRLGAATLLLFHPPGAQEVAGRSHRTCTIFRSMTL